MGGDFRLLHAHDPGPDAYLFVTRQVMWTVLGLAVLALAMRVDYRTYRNDTFVWALLGLVTLMLIAAISST